MALNKLPDSTPPPVSVSSPIRLSFFFFPSLLLFNVLRHASVFSQNGSVRPSIHFLPPDPRPAVIGQRQGTLKDGLPIRGRAGKVTCHNSHSFHESLSRSFISCYSVTIPISFLPILLQSVLFYNWMLFFLFYIYPEYFCG